MHGSYGLQNMWEDGRDEEVRAVQWLPPADVEGEPLDDTADDQVPYNPVQHPGK